MKLEKLFMQKTLNSPFNFLRLINPAAKKDLHTWLVVSSLSLIILGASLFSIQKNKALELALLNNQHHGLAEENEDLKDKLHAFDHFEGSQNEIAKRLENMSKLADNHESISKLLSTVAISVRKRTVIRRITVVRPVLTNDCLCEKKNDSFTIDGTTPCQKEVVAFTKYLTHVEFISKVNIESLVQAKGAQPSVNFSLSGIVKHPETPQEKQNETTLI